MASSLCGPAELPAASLEAGNPTGGRGLKLFFGLGLIEQCPMPARLRVGRRQEGLVADAKCQSVFLPASPRKEHRITQLGETLELLLQLHLQCQPGRWDGGGGGCGPALIHWLRCVCVCMFQTILLKCPGQCSESASWTSTTIRPNWPCPTKPPSVRMPSQARCGESGPTPGGG